MKRLKARMRNLVPVWVFHPLRGLYRIVKPRDLKALAAFVVRPIPGITLGQRLRLAWGLTRIAFGVDYFHTQADALRVMVAILELPREVPGVVVEAGAYKGGSAAKWSLAANLTGRRIAVFDSFEGIPPNTEDHGVDILGRHVEFPEGSFSGVLDEVKRVVAKYGHPEICDYYMGWFEETMPRFDEPVAAAYIDVDLASSTRTCLKNLYPRLSAGGVLFSQDGHLPLVLEVFNDERFWRDEVGADKPTIDGEGEAQLISLRRGRLA